MQWLTKLMEYMGTGVTGMEFTYWSWNPNSGDTGGIARDDWKTVNQQKQSILQPYLIPPVGGETLRRPRRRRVHQPPTTEAGRHLPGWLVLGRLPDRQLALVREFQGEVTVTAGNAAITSWAVRWTYANGQTISRNMRTVR